MVLLNCLALSCIFSKTIKLHSKSLTYLHDMLRPEVSLQLLIHIIRIKSDKLFLHFTGMAGKILGRSILQNLLFCSQLCGSKIG